MSLEPTISARSKSPPQGASKGAAGARSGGILTINLEDYFQTTPVSEVVPVRYWSRFERRVERNTERTLSLLEETGASATFFVSGWIADVAADLVREIGQRGHRIAAKGYQHAFPKQLTAAEFADDARRAKEALERASGSEIVGYRAARGGLSIDDTALFDALADIGYRYDSSVRPFGFGAGPRNAVVAAGSPASRFSEVPISTASLAGLTIPVAGGNFLRQLPYSFTRRAIANTGADPHARLVFYFHVWELDPEMPRLNGVTAANRIRLYRNLEAMPRRIAEVLGTNAFTSAEEALGIAPASAPEAPRSAEIVSIRTGKAPGARDVTLVVPCFNEAESLPFLEKSLALLEQRLKAKYALCYVFVDDGSSDGTLAVLGRLFGKRRNVTIHAMPRNSGVSAAIMAGIKRARTDIVASIDCDCSYDPFQIETLLDAWRPEIAMVTASPYHRQGHVMNVPGWRLFLSRGLSMLYRLLLDQKLATYTSCLRVYRRSAVAGIELEHGGYLGIAELVARLDQRGEKIEEVPATLESRLFGRSKMKTLKTIAGHLGLLAGLVRDKFRHADPNFASPNFTAPGSPDTGMAPPPQTMEKDRG
ncbi:MAG: DUF3473 domain-containing protein [Flavobacteriaceae bacterium]